MARNFCPRDPGGRGESFGGAWRDNLERREAYLLVFLVLEKIACVFSGKVVNLHSGFRIRNALKR